MLKSRTWFTEDTDILTTAGWVSIKSLKYIKDVLVVEENIQANPIIEFNKAYYKGEVSEWKMEDFYCKAKNLILPNNKIWRVGKELELPKPTKVHYEGLLYNVVTPTNNLITRCLKKGRVTEDYILSICKIAD